MASQGTIKKWTEEEKTRFLVQAVKQMQTGGAKLNFKKLEYEGRTAKALTHLWDKISKDAAYEKQDGDAADDDAAAAKPGSEASTPTPKTPTSKRGGTTPAGRKRTAQKAEIGEDNGDATPSVKRQRKAPASKAAKAKAAAAAAAAAQAVDEDESEDIKPEDIKPELNMDEEQQLQQNGFDPIEI
ncbi:hypothetical protein F4803DRAFT_546100 [Xylaria telfairii]|nr:hypothetical protein F4803DRAFT_546100 [Xylaria telfairii]